jgi:hypothetical protein
MRVDSAARTLADKRAKPATLAAYESYLRTHIIPTIGNMELSAFGNAALKSSVKDREGASPKSTQEISAFTRAIVLSAVDAEGEPLYSRTWRLDFVDAPPVVNQRQPTITKQQLQDALRVRHSHTDKYRVIIAVPVGLRFEPHLNRKLAAAEAAGAKTRTQK